MCVSDGVCVSLCCADGTAEVCLYDYDGADIIQAAGQQPPPVFQYEDEKL